MSTFTAPASATTGLQSYDLEGARARRRKRRKKLTTTAGDPATKESTMDELKLFIPITKVDAAKRLVYGVVTAEMPDVTGEVCDYATTKPLYEKWSAQFAKATDGLSVGNLRAMHSNIAAGKLTDIVFNDAAKAIEVCAHVVDDGEWRKVEEGVYTGFSQGGKYIKRWPDPEQPKLMRYTAEPIEVSLVDNPCLPDATFSIIKADGTAELRKFKPAPVAAVANPEDGDWEQVWISKRLPGKEFTTKAALRQALVDLDAADVANKQAAPVLDMLAEVTAKLAKAGGDADTDAGKTNTDPVAGDGTKVAKKNFTDDERKKLAGEGKAMKDGSFPIENKSDLENAIKAYGRAKNKAAAKRHIIKRAKALGATDMLPADWPGSTQGKKADKLAGDGDLAKAGSLGGVGRLVMLLGEIEWMEDDAEAPAWGFGVDLPKALCDRFGAALVEIGDIAAEMLDAVLTSIKAEEASEAVANAARILDLQKVGGAWMLVKAGARHSKADKDRIKKLHDGLVDLDSDCCPAGDGEDNEDDEAEKLAKGLQAKLDASEKAFAKTLDNIMVLVKQIADQPLPMGTTSVRIVEKSQDFGNWADKLSGSSEGDGLERLGDAARQLALNAHAGR